MSGADKLTADVDIDLKGLLFSVWRKKFLVLFLTLLGGALIFVAVSMMSPRYKSDAKILIKKRESVFTRITNNEVQPNGGEFDENAVGSQVLILNSDDLASQVIKKLNLENHPEFQKNATGNGIFDLAKSLITPPEAPQTRVDEQVPVVNPGVLKQFRKQLTAYAAEKSRVAVVEFWSTDRGLAEAVPNTIADLYLQFTKNATLDSDKNATGYLAPEIKSLRKKVAEAEEKVAEFRSNSDILLGNNNALLATQQLSEVSSELSRVRAERSSAEAKVDTITAALKNGGSIDVVPEVLSSPLIQRLRERQVAVQGQISQLSTTLLPNHPQIKALRSQLPSIEKQIRKAANDILKSLENNVDLARQKEAVLLQDVNRLKAESSRVGEAEVQLRALEREATAQRERLEKYLGRFNEASSRQASGYVPSEARIIEHAMRPAESYFPKIIPFTLAGMVAIAILTMVGILTAELLSGRAFKTVARTRDEHMPEQVADHVVPAKAPPLAPTMDTLLQDSVPAFSAPTHVANDQDIFGVNFAMQAIDGLQKASVVVTSSDHISGTATSAQIGRYLAKQGKSVVISDFTGEGSTAMSLLGRNDLKGFFDVVAGQVALRDVIFADSQSAMHILAAGQLDSANCDLSRMGQIIASLRSSYDYVIFDSGTATVAGLSKIADAQTVIIIPVNDESINSAKALENQLKASGYCETLLVKPDRLGETPNFQVA